MRRIITKFSFVSLLLFTNLFTMELHAQDVLGDIRFERAEGAESKAFPPSIFPHWKHRINYRCDACHDILFKMKKGGTPVTMELIGKGETCGECHNGELAFSTSINTCNRCHTPLKAE